MLLWNSASITLYTTATVTNAKFPFVTHSKGNHKTGRQRDHNPTSKKQTPTRSLAEQREIKGIKERKRERTCCTTKMKVNTDFHGNFTCKMAYSNWTSIKKSFISKLFMLKHLLNSDFKKSVSQIQLLPWRNIVLSYVFRNLLRNWSIRSLFTKKLYFTQIQKSASRVFKII